jgi:hypothetical protein
MTRLSMSQLLCAKSNAWLKNLRTRSGNAIRSLLLLAIQKSGLDS